MASIFDGKVEGKIAHDAADSGSPVKIGGVANEYAPTPVADGDRVQAWFDQYGRLVVNLDKVIAGEDLVNHVLATTPEAMSIEAHGLETYDNAALEASGSIKAAPGRLYYVHAYNSDVTDHHLQLFDASSASGAGNFCFLVPAGGYASFDFGSFGRFFEVEMSWGISTDPMSYTSAGAVCRVMAGYK